MNERNQNKNKTMSRHIQIDHTLYCLIQPTNNAMVSLKDGFIFALTKSPHPPLPSPVKVDIICVSPLSYIHTCRVITVKKATYLKNIFDLRLYQFIVFTFLLKPLHKVFLQLISNKRLNFCVKKIFSGNDS